MLRRLWPCCLLIIAACTGGGAGGDTAAPIPLWGSFRRDNANSGLASSAIKDNPGEVRFAVKLTDGDAPATLSSPAIGLDHTIYLGTAEGLVALDDTGNIRWRLQRCNLAEAGAPCEGPLETCVEVGAVDSSPAVTLDGDVVFASERGIVFAVHDDGEAVTCRWAFQVPASGTIRMRSSPQVIIDALDNALSAVFIGTGAGWLQALNGDGTARWRFQGGPGGLGSVSSTPAIGGGFIYLTAPDGFLYALDFAGQLRWNAEVGIPLESDGLAPSAAVSDAVIAIGAGGAVVAYHPDGTFKWRFEPRARIAGSPAFARQTIQHDNFCQGDGTCSVSDNLCATDDDCRNVCRDGQCTLSTDTCEKDGDCEQEGVGPTFESVVYVVDERGATYGIRGPTGTLLEQQVCSVSREFCSSHADPCPSGQTCCSQADGDGTCSVEVATTQLVTGTAIRSSPAVSADLYVVVGTEDGRVCAKQPTGLAPTGAGWQNGCVTVREQHAVRSSPVIATRVGDDFGTIYVTTDDGFLYAIGSAQ